MQEDFVLPTHEYKLPGYEDQNKKLGPEQLEIVKTQLSDFETVSAQSLNSELKKSLSSGNSILPAGTLIHGTTIDNMDSIAKHGVMSGEFFGKPEDGETHYCADFYKVRDDSNIAEYSQFISKPEESSSLKMQSAESKKLPSDKRGGDFISIIVDAKIPEVQELIEADPYRPDTESLLDGIVDINSLPAEKGSKKAERFSSILVGMPANTIAGLVVGNNIAGDAEKIESIKNSFNNRVAIYDILGNPIFLPESSEAN
jgi:hypothetical protein